MAVPRYFPELMGPADKETISHSTLKSDSETRPCSACHHPPNKLRGPVAVITSLNALRHRGKSGCLSCSVLSAGIDGVIGDDALRFPNAVERLRMDINMAASGQSLTITLFKRQLEISVFAPPPSSKTLFNWKRTCYRSGGETRYLIRHDSALS